VSSIAEDGVVFFQFSRPVEYATRNVGSVDVRVRKDSLEAAAGSARILLIGLGMLVFVVGIGLSWVAGKVMLGPLRRLNHALREAAQGRLDFRISHRRRDEFGELFDNFNALATDTQERLERARVDKPAKDDTPARDMAATVLRKPTHQTVWETGT
jgi:methyl-accepting chemotaxis protein